MKGSSYFSRQFAFVLGLAALQFGFCVGNVHPDTVEIWAHQIGTKIHNFAVHVTGSAAVEKEQFSLTAKDQNGTRMVKDVSKKLQNFFNKKIDSLQKLATRAEEANEAHQYDENIKPFEYLDMKNEETLASYNLTYNDVFGMNVTYKLSGIHVPTDVYDKAAPVLNTIKWTEALDEVFINNSNEDPGFKWQYFGSETGVFRSYPAAPFDVGPKGIDLYDARKRPWYIHGSTSPKSFVIIVDGSGSMYGRPLLIARLAVAELIDTFSENDFFNLIWFNIDVNYLACKKKFVQATSQNKKFYKSKLRDIEAGYVAMWPKAYEAAFQLFESVSDDRKHCQKAIAVFTDGPTERAESVFKTYNSEKKVRVFTYAVGPPAHSIEALRSIACNNRGFFYRIPGVGSVRDVMKGYVSVLSRPMAKENKHDPIWSSVYVDSGPFGMLITGTLPTFVRTNSTAEILGVVGTDVTLDDLDNFFDLTSLGVDAYSFIINNNGHVVKHPGFAVHRGYLPDPPDVNISDIEYSWDVNSTKPLKLRSRMLATQHDEVGTMTYDVALFSRDDLNLRVKKRTMNYYFTRVEGSPMWVAIVLPSTAVEIVSGEAAVNETVVNFLCDYWEKNPASENDVERFVKTFTDSFYTSKSASDFRPEEGILSRVDQYPNDITVVTVPYNSGKENVDNVNITGYRKIMANASGTFVNIGVVGFNMNHSKFQQDYFFNPSFQGNSQYCNATNDEEEGNYCYLIDENAFIVAASVDSEKVTGQFFGNVDAEVMEQLVTGGSTEIYERIDRTDPQGSCVDPSAGSASSAPFLQPFWSGTSYIKWCFAKAVWFVANLNVYNWFYGNPVSAETTEIEKPQNKTCIMQITAYYSVVNNENITKQGQAKCESCISSSCQRSFVISKVPKTNLYLVVVDGRCPLSRQTRFNGVPGAPEEVIRSEDEEEEAVCIPDPYRKDISRCFTSNDPETGYPCGRSGVISVSVLLMVFALFSSSCNLRLL